jgi:hypothetical protein
VENLDRVLPGLRDEDFANWGAYLLEDIGVIELDRVVGSIPKFGARIRQEMTWRNGVLNPHWSELAIRLHLMSPAMTNPNSMLASMCQLAAAKLLLEGRINAQETD